VASKTTRGFLAGLDVLEELAVPLGVVVDGEGALVVLDLQGDRGQA
jgi:hypothetical protein